MSRWTIEKDGTGIERSGTGIEKSGTGIEKSGTGIEKSGTGVEKSGSGIQRFAFACAIALVGFTSSSQAGSVNPAGSLQLVVDQETIAVSWIIDGSVFSGISTLSGRFANLQLTEISLASQSIAIEVTGGGTGDKTLVTGGGTGGRYQVTGGGTGISTQVTGGGTGISTQVTGGGTGISTQVTGGGTGISTQVTGGGTGSSTLVTGGGTGSSILVTGGGTGTEAITINLPDGSGLGMEISLRCNSATVTVMDASYSPVVRFENVNVVGNTGLCGGDSGGLFTNPGFDYLSN
jgi:hypothetical protein